MDQISGTSPADARGQLQATTVSAAGTGAATSGAGVPAGDTGAPVSEPAIAGGPASASAAPTADRRESGRAGFGSRGRARRRARFLRKARELAYRDLGGLVFNLHRFGQRNDALVLAKLNTLTQIDTELRTLESALQEREPVTVLREAGITACPRCAAIHSSEDRFCPNCGLSMARHVDLPIAGAAGAAPSAGAPAPAAPAPAAPAPAPAPPAPVAPAPGATAPFAPTPGAPAPPAPGTTSPPTAAGGTTAPFPAPAPGTATPAPARPPEEATEILRPGAPRP